MRATSSTAKGLALAALLGFCAHVVGAPAGLAQSRNAAAPAAGRAPSETPRFYIEWRPDLPDLTQRPGLADGSPLPIYPQAALRNSETGTTEIETCVTVDGRLVGARISRSSGSRSLDAATLAWAKTAKYLPAKFRNEPFAVCGYRFEQVWRVQ